MLARECARCGEEFFDLLTNIKNYFISYEKTY